LTLAMVLAAGVFLTALMGMAYVLWRSREVPVPPPPPLGPIVPHEEALAVTATHERPESESPVPSSEPSKPPEPSKPQEPSKPPEPPKSAEPSSPSEGSGEGQTTG
jgi:outer membrane biosynthesis protein TonB